MHHRSPKKSENIEIRVPHGMKTDFMTRCRGDGRSASDVLRGFIEAYLADEASSEIEERPIMARIGRAVSTEAVAASAL